MFEFQTQTYRKKPVEVEATQWDGTGLDAIEVIKWLSRHGVGANYIGAQPESVTPEGFKIPACPARIYINTLEGTMAATGEDFIIKGVNGEFYPCKPDIITAFDEHNPDYIDAVVLNTVAMAGNAVPHWGIPYSPEPANDCWTWPVIER